MMWKALVVTLLLFSSLTSSQGADWMDAFEQVQDQETPPLIASAVWNPAGDRLLVIGRAGTDQYQWGGPSFAIGETLRIQADYLLMCWGRVRDGTLSHEAFLSELPTLQNAVHQALCAGSQCEHPKTAATCRRLLAVEDALWTFATHPDVEPTNNAAERALRAAVIWRKTSYGTQSEAGSRFVERILTVVTSARQQGRHPFELVRDAIQAQRSGTTPPSLL